MADVVIDPQAHTWRCTWFQICCDGYTVFLIQWVPWEEQEKRNAIIQHASCDRSLTPCGALTSTEYELYHSVQRYPRWGARRIISESEWAPTLCMWCEEIPGEARGPQPVGKSFYSRVAKRIEQGRRDSCWHCLGWLMKIPHMVSSMIVWIGYQRYAVANTIFGFSEIWVFPKINTRILHVEWWTW